ncbi:peptide/nickel transport system ATP-binding protein/oligopeptide transport system ATP-binding protein [Actinomadura pelletieri DSM 43383]|uniref:Peptide/nickel transport system ATP-binding protein/oligopeptide transport system ATP-binding protein n=1 Tax=Actinomadura pelletieri DSM 43383 TaxID=1120940 RepID=A0A495Q8Z4_9ACTN|nr:ABC transporter ATP-binding protein [Actinomadura pelletieri]RKS67778.1 peptide/nickel transport system ATP-binding protein/oligopeptide transport system ATP-binding protein [Actinomadura pelletieri DSM 43383]
MTTNDPAVPAPRPEAPLLQVADLHVRFRVRGRDVRAVNGLSYTLAEGETVAILGESGSGKSVAAQAVMGLLDSPPAQVDRGSVRLRGAELLGLPERRRRAYRGEHLSMIFQDASTALNPVFTVGDQLAEMYRVHRGLGRRAARDRAVELMERVRIPSAGRRLGDHPHRFSGGMRQRVMIAMALALEPDVLIADEPTTALDVTVQAQIMRLLAALRDELNMGLVLITHDLGVVAGVADRIVVMYAGSVAERSPVRDLYARPAHPYTRGLLASVPRLGPRLGSRRAPLVPIAGAPPDPAALPSGCPFRPRCARAEAVCAAEAPPLVTVAPGHDSACHFAEEVHGAGTG